MQTVDDYKEDLVQLEAGLIESITAELARVGGSVVAEDLDISGYLNHGFLENIKVIQLNPTGEAEFNGDFENSNSLTISDALADGQVSTWDLISLLDNLSNYEKGC